MSITREGAERLAKKVIKEYEEFINFLRSCREVVSDAPKISITVRSKGEVSVSEDWSGNVSFYDEKEDHRCTNIYDSDRKSMFEEKVPEGTILFVRLRVLEMMPKIIHDYYQIIEQKKEEIRAKAERETKELEKVQVMIKGKYPAEAVAGALKEWES